MTNIPSHWLIPKMYTVEGTREPSRTFLRAVLAGDPEQVAKTLAILHPSHTIGWHWEPYANLSSKKQLEALKLLLDHPQFRFDAEFLAACCYFTPTALRDLVCCHPRARRWAEDPSTVWKDAELCYCSTGRTLNVGLQQRPYYAVQELQRQQCIRLRIRRRWALAFMLYPALVAWARCRVEDYYAPGGMMMQKGQARFEALQAAAPEN